MNPNINILSRIKRVEIHRLRTTSMGSGIGELSLGPANSPTGHLLCCLHPTPSVSQVRPPTKMLFFGGYFASLIGHPMSVPLSTCSGPAPWPSPYPRFCTEQKATSKPGSWFSFCPSLGLDPPLKLLNPWHQAQTLCQYPHKCFTISQFPVLQYQLTCPGLVYRAARDESFTDLYNGSLCHSCKHSY